MSYDTEPKPREAAPMFEVNGQWAHCLVCRKKKEHVRLKLRNVKSIQDHAMRHLQERLARIPKVAESA
jgi:hypothetical protein